jgi:large subunit ribosomal protein L23
MKSSYEIIRRPIITEKATLASEVGGVVFEVAIKSNKAQIKEAVENLFKVKVKAVNTSISKARESVSVVSWESREMLNELM